MNVIFLPLNQKKQSSKLKARYCLCLFLFLRKKEEISALQRHPWHQTTDGIILGNYFWSILRTVPSISSMDKVK